MAEPFFSSKPKAIVARSQVSQPPKGPGIPSASLGSRAKKSNIINARSGQSPVESPEGQIPSDKPAPPGSEPKLMPEAEEARKGGMMARIPPAPPGVLPESPDPRASYQVKPTDDSSALIKVGPSAPSPKPSLSGIDVGSQSKEPQSKEPVAIPPGKSEAKVAQKEEEK
jgi:hypothetical protein